MSCRNKRLARGRPHRQPLPQWRLTPRHTALRARDCYHRFKMSPLGKKERSEVIRRFASGLKYPYLFALLLIVFLVDLIFPDPIPFADEIIFGLLAVLFGTWRDRRRAALPEAEGQAEDSSE